MDYKGSYGALMRFVQNPIVRMDSVRPQSGVCNMRSLTGCNGVRGRIGLGWILETTLCPPHRSAIPVGASLNFFPTFFKKE